MANNKDNQNRQKPNSNANSQPMPEEYSNEANHKGAQDLGTDGTKASASQQQGQGAWRAKDSKDQGKSK
ncbi:hypothetical protein [Pontibacter indicus]|uniref:Uncharacterized protein n=1 Tax=Pontibacter indicus TaxID=1317125 RepID=A0A1R3XKY4_9BACT|nr:hypothetical protein [Pontibacter indicus]SIT92338.1 hypothetical protein SAMN05444128_2810 [Pontibacter indicus]